MGVEKRKRMMLDIEHFIWIRSLVINDRVACNRASKTLSIHLLAVLKRRAYHSVQLRAVNVWRFRCVFFFHLCKIHTAMYNIHRTTAGIKMSECISRKQIAYNLVIGEECDWKMRKEEMNWIILLFWNEFWFCVVANQRESTRVGGRKWFYFFLWFFVVLLVDSNRYKHSICNVYIDLIVP